MSKLRLNLKRILDTLVPNAKSVTIMDLIESHLETWYSSHQEYRTVWFVKGQYEDLWCEHRLIGGLGSPYITGWVAGTTWHQVEHSDIYKRIDNWTSMPRGVFRDHADLWPCYLLREHKGSNDFRDRILKRLAGVTGMNSKSLKSVCAASKEDVTEQIGLWMNLRYPGYSWVKTADDLLVLCDMLEEQDMAVQEIKLIRRWMGWMYGKERSNG